MEQLEAGKSNALTFSMPVIMLSFGSSFRPAAARMAYRRVHHRLKFHKECFRNLIGSPKSLFESFNLERHSLAKLLSRIRQDR
jgi:hypothetical protein